MTDTYVAVNGHRAASLRLTVGNKGPWVADVDLEEAPELSGRVSLTIGPTLTLSGTIDPDHNGTFGLGRKLRIVAGGGGWAKTLPAKNYHNDAGQKARNVADDAAREAGETIGTFVPRAERMGRDYARRAQAASLTLEDAANGAVWWLDYAGVTHVGTRPALAHKPSTYEVVAFEPDHKVVTLSVDDPAQVTIGSTISERLDAPVVVRDMTLTVTASELRIVAWCGGNADGEARLPGLLRSIIEHATAGRAYGKFRYRVVSTSGDRVNLQAVRKGAGLPDVLPVSQWPGVAGVHAELTPGAEVLVEFIEGDKTLPIVTHFAGRDGVGFIPVSLALCGGTRPVAAVGDQVTVMFPPTCPVSGTVSGNPFTGTLTLTSPGLGIIAGPGNPLVLV